MNTNPDLEKFMLLSKALTAKKNLNEKIGGEYLNRLELQFPADMQAVLAEIDKIVAASPKPTYQEFELKRKLIENDKFSTIIQQILRIWYTSQFVVADDKTDIRTTEQYRESLLWQVVHTDVPGADKKKKYGFWGRKPSLK